MKHKLYNRLLSLALAVGLVVGMLPGSAAVSVTEGSAGQPVTLVNGDQVSFTLPVKLYGDDGTDLSSAGAVEISIQNGGTVPLPGEYTNGIETISIGDETYKFSYVADSVNGSKVSTLEAGMFEDTQEKEDGGWPSNDMTKTTTTTYTYAVWYGAKPNSVTANNIIATRSYQKTTIQKYKRDSWFSGWYKVGDPTTTETPLSAQSNKKTIHFMYDKDGTLVPVKELTRDKIVTLNDDGTYDLTLTVSGAAGSITNPQKLDILFIFDRSNSMNNSSRLRYVKTAAKSLVNTLQDNKAIDARYSIVTFSSYSDYDGGLESDAECYLEWSEWEETGNYWNPSNNIADSIDEIYTRGGTNYQAGIRKGITQLNSCRSGAQKVVIFLTDGLPTYRIGGGNGQNDRDEKNIDAAVREIKGMNADAFYAIGVGSDFNNQSSTPVQNLNQLCNNVNATQTGLYTAGDSGSSSDLEEIFQNIAGDAVSILCSNVTVRDTLSENVEIVTGGSGSGTPTSDDFTITVVGEDGQTVATGKGSVQVDDVTISARYNEATRQIVLDFPDNYQLKKGYTYKVTTKIQATEAAYEAYRNNGNSYPDTGDQGTGTHAGQLGLYTNNKATVDYTYNGKNYSAEYPMPVIQLKPGTLTITKRITGDLENTDITALEENLTFTVNLNGEESSYKLNEFTPGANNTYSLTIKGLSPVTDYTVTESNATVTGYTLQTTKENDTGTVTKGGSATAQFVNDYQNTKNEYPVRFYLEGIQPNVATDYPFADAWAKLNSLLSTGYANVTTTLHSSPNYPDLSGETGFDSSVKGGSVPGGIRGDNNVKAWLTKYSCDPNLSTTNIKEVLEKLVALYPDTNLENAVVTTVGGKQYTIQNIIDNPSNFRIVYTQVTKNHDQLLEYYKGNGSLQQGQDSYHVHLSVRKNPGNLTITKTFSGVESLPSNFAIEVRDSVGTLVDKLTLEEAAHTPGTNTYTWTLENLNEDTYTVTETGTDVENMVLSATMKVTDEDVQTQETVEDTTAQVKVANNKTSTVDITNTYTPADGYLTIQKEISGTPFGDGRDTFNFKVTATSGKDEGKVWYFTIKGAGETEAIKLPVGEYKVKELSNINYACETSETIVTINNSNTEANPATVTFTNTPDKTDIPTDGGGVKNVPGTDNDGKFVWKPEQYGNKGKIEEDPETTE